PALLIPLPASASRGDQILNARSFCKQGFSGMIDEDTMTDEQLLEAILSLYENRDKYIAAMKQSKSSDAIAAITGLIEEAAGK
nr:UDP-N-acetylglucosamine--N-acetylmuramyl-(pentapeptide) pyrophosphoryl-undecaprenol N-acetylglucosamine transferase [Lachnospiraceae bacterium]